MSPPPAPIAVIGVGCRLPGGASNLDKLWQLLSEGRNGQTEIPKDRWNADEWFDAYPEAKQSVVTKHGYFLQEDVSQFDAKFFGISSAEAHCMDPQQRLLLMTAYEAIEDAGIPVETLRGSNTGVFAAVFERSYDRMGHKDLSTLGRTHLNGTGESILSNRISYCFDLQGPCMTIDTGCSGSLVALHQACYSLRSGESDLALVGGSQIVLHPDLLTTMSAMGMINPDGLSYVFDSRGAGYGRGEGVATIVLKRLDRALADGDRVHAVIANSGVNQDGKTTGINNPSGAAQAALSSRVYREAGLNPGDTVFVEAHGTGTQVGDKEEITSISKVFCEDPGRSDDLYVGSIKSNIGHLEASSGLAGLLKCILVLKHGHIPPQLNYIQPKPSLKLYEKKIKIPVEGRDLPSPHNGGPRRISLNSFGYGGSNCHVIIQDAPSVPQINGHTNGVYSHENTNGTGHAAAPTAVPQLFVLGASTEKALLSLPQNLKQWASTHEVRPQTLRSLSYTLGVHRSALQYRRAIVAATWEELLAELDQPGHQKRVISLAPVSFVFSGQGAQWNAMGRELISSSPCFRQSISAMEETLREQGCEWSLIGELSKSAEESRIGEAEISQPATTAVQIALVDLLESLSIRPSRVVGHSSGEIGAAYAAGALNRTSAIIVAYQRGLFSAKAKAVADIPGSMMAVSLEEGEATRHVKRLTSGTAVVACVNSPSSMTISGDETAIDELKGVLDAEGVFARKLKVDTAYHSHHMRRVGQEYEGAINDIETSSVRPGVTFYSSVTGAVKTTGFGADYWTSNMVSQVKFSKALALLRDDQTRDETGMDSSIFVEIGPHSALAGPSRQTLIQGGTGKFKFEYLSALVRNSDAVKTTLSLVGRIFELGLEVDMRAALTMTDEKKPAVIRDLASYPWDLAPFWRESRLSKASRFRQFPHHDLLGLLDPASTLHEPRWRYHINLDALPWLRDHIVEGFVLYPGAGYMTMAIEAMKQLVQMRKTQKRVIKFVLRDMKISKSLILDEPENGDGEIEVQLSMTTASQYESSRWESFRIWSCNAEGAWSEHCTGEISVEYEASESDEVEGTRETDLREQEAMQFMDEARQHCDAEMTRADFYEFAKLSGNKWDGAFSAVEDFSYGNMRGIGRIVNPDVGGLMPYRSFRPHVIHPTTIDAMFQLQAILFKKFISNAVCVPTKISLMEISADITSKPGDSLTSATQIETDGAKLSKGHSWVFQEDASGQLKPVIRLSLNLRAIGDAVEDENRPFIEDKVNRLDWNLDADSLTQSSYINALASTTGLDENTTYDYEGNRVSLADGQKAFRAADRAALIWIRDAARYLEENNIEVTKPHFVKYLAWIKKWLSSEYYGELVSGLSPEDESQALQLIESSPDSAPELQLLARVGKALPSILSGMAEPLAVMLEGNLLIRSYEGGTFAGDYEAAVAYLKILTFKNPRLRFLEIGAGTGGCTKRVLGGLAGQNGGPGLLPLEKYAYTDISSGFFQEARASFAEWEDYIDFKTLDVGKDPIEQGFEPESFDVVVAANVLHATENMDVTMSHVRKILRPGGSLILVENQPRGVALSLVFGTFSGWWAHEDEFRVDTALMHREQWSTILSRNGFGGIHVARESMMVSKAVQSLSNGTAAEENKIVLLRDSSDDRVDEIVKNITGIVAEESRWDQASGGENALYLIFDRAENPLLLNPRPQVFETLNTLSSAKANILWVVLQDTDKPELTAYMGAVSSLIRVLRRESADTGIVSLHIRHASPGPDETARVVSDIARRCFWPATPDQRSSETEFAYEHGQVVIPRIKPDAAFLRWGRQKWAQYGGDPDAGAEVENAPYQGDRALKVEVATPGLLGSLRFVDNEMPSDIEASEIEVNAEAHGINDKDVAVALGQASPGAAMVGEFAGVVVAVGADMQDKYQVGDRVMGFGAQPFSNRSRVHGYLAHKTPASMSNTVAASTPLAYVTAYQCIMETARLESGQTILIHAASRDVGQAAIQLAQHVGAEIFCTVGSAAKRQLLINEYGVPESHIFSSQSDSFKQGIMRLTNGEGVDVVLGQSTGEALRSGLDCVKTLGTFIQLGKSETQRGSQLSMSAFERSITFTSFDLVSLSERKPKHIHRILGEVIALCESKILRPVLPITSYPIEKIEEAFRLVNARKQIGKVVLVAEPTSMVKSLPPKAAALELRKDATYVVAGGLGNLPTKISHFLASRGAGHIVSLSRRTIDDETRQKYTAAIEALGAKLHIVKCDITDADQMSDAVKYCSALPPVRGVVQGALKLQDRTFSHMTVDDWNLAIRPKVIGTISLNKNFASPDLDFFVTLSSVSATVGKSGLSNYIAGNGFQDAYMRAHADHPNTQYISINIGPVSIEAHSGGDFSAAMAALRQNSLMEVSFDEFFANFEYAVSSLARGDDLHQTIQGVTRQSMLEANDVHLLEDPLFSQMPRAQERKTAGASGTEKIDFGEALSRAKTPGEAEQLVRDAIVAKFAVFLDRAIDEIRVDQSLATIGLDSLVSIELKNWIVRTFQVNLQTSELGGSGSIQVLTATILTRSKLVSDEVRQPLPEEAKSLVQEVVATEKEEPKPNHDFYCCRASKELPRYPLVDLDEAVKDLMTSVGHFAHTREEYTELVRKVDALAAPGGFGRRLYGQLRARADDPNVESWIADLLLKALHLKRRYTLAPFGNFLCTHFDSPVPHTQAERAAALTRAICEFKKDLDEGRLEPDFLGTRANCGHSRSWLFNAVREPNLGCDKMMKYPGNEYAAVLRQGRLFKVQLRDGDGILSHDKLRATYQAILDLNLEEKSWAGILTTDNRDAWGTNRQQLLSIDDKNAAYFDTIEASAFVVCLDEDSPVTRAERVHSGYIGDGFNRWHDKCFQLIINANGRSATIFEHSMIDVMTTWQVAKRMQNAINTLVPSNSPSSAPVDPSSLEEIPLVTAPDINTHIEVLRENYLAITSSKKYVPYQIPGFGKAAILSHSAPIKATVDLTIQLASRMYFGYLPASWETVSTSHFHLGRPEIVQVVRAEVIEFCDAALDENVPRAEVRAKLMRAAREHNAQVSKGTEGKNYFRLMDVLEVMAQDQDVEEVPEMFSDPVWRRGYPQLIMQTMTETKLFEDPGFTMPDPESVWTNYSVFDDSLEVCFVSPVESAERFQAALDRAADMVKTIIAARQE